MLFDGAVPVGVLVFPVVIVFVRVLLIWAIRVVPVWNRRLLYRLFECWVLLFRKEGRNYPDRIREIIAGLRKDQRLHEKTYLKSGLKGEDKINALRLVALYDWAKATELLAEWAEAEKTLTKYMLQEQPRIIPSDLDKHFKSSIKAAQ